MKRRAKGGPAMTLTDRSSAIVVLYVPHWPDMRPVPVSGSRFLISHGVEGAGVSSWNCQPPVGGDDGGGGSSSSLAFCRRSGIPRGCAMPADSPELSVATTEAPPSSWINPHALAALRSRSL